MSHYGTVRDRIRIGIENGVLPMKLSEFLLLCYMCVSMILVKRADERVLKTETRQLFNSQKIQILLNHICIIKKN